MNISAQKLTRRLLAVSSLALIAGCGGKYAGYDPDKDAIDRASNLTTKDYVKQLFPKPEEVTVETKTPPLPKPADLILTPQKPRTGINKTVSISVTEDVPLKDVFIELARLADADIEVDSKISGGVIFKAKNKPFDEVIERITDMAGLRYSVNNGVIRIEADNEYVENYSASFLNVIRKTTSSISTSNKLASGDSGGGGGSGSGGGGGASGGGGGGNSGGGNSGGGSSGSSSSGENGSESKIESKSGSDGDIWNSIQGELNAIIGNPASAGSGSSTSSAGAPGAPGGPTGAAATTTGVARSDNGESVKFVSMNREAGVISIKTTAKNHAKIKEYLAKVKEYYSSQVLIEAKVLEVTLKDEFRSGVNWSIVSKRQHGAAGTNDSITLPSDGFPATDLADSANIALINIARGDLTAAVQLAQVFGTTKTLSSPRILAMNNQPAVLTFTKNENYYSLTCTVTPAVTTATSFTPAVVSSSSTLHTIPIGVILNMQPSIDVKNNEVSLIVRPTLSRLTGKTTDDPNARLCAISAASTGDFSEDFLSQIQSAVPQVDVREMDSILRLKSGEVMAIGGMIDQKNENFDSGIPFLSDIPVLGNAFKTVDKDNENIQTVIFLKATIVPSYGVDEDDQRIYNKFNNDPRALKF